MSGSYRNVFPLPTDRRERERGASRRSVAVPAESHVTTRRDSVSACLYRLMARGRGKLADRPEDALAAGAVRPGLDGAAPVPPGPIRSTRFTVRRDGGLHIHGVPWGKLVAVLPDSPARHALYDPDAGKPLNHRGTQPFEMLLRRQTVHAVDLSNSTERQPVQDHRRHIHLCTEDIGLVPPNRAQVRYGPYLVGHQDRRRV